MSRSADHPRRARRDEGFTLIEIIVALGIFSLVLVALLPQLVTGIRATATARTVSQAKGISQGQLERMRHLPFHIAPAAGDFVDVLDYYYPDLGTPATTPTCMTAGKYNLPAIGWAGYVPAGSAARCSYEPAAGAFYRTVKVVPAATGITTFTVVVDTQFLSGATPPQPVSPLAGYDTGLVGQDSPASPQIGVTTTVLYDRRGTLRPVSNYSQIAERLTSTSRIRSQADVRVMDVGTVTAAKVPLTLSAGLLNLTGSVSYASTVNVNLAATSAGLATGDQSAGSSATRSAPPSLTTTPVPGSAGQLTSDGCALACWGSTTASGYSLSADNGLPRAGSVTSPVQLLVSDLTNAGLSFGASATNDYRSGLALAPPLVRIAPTAGPQPSGLSTSCTTSATGASAYLSATGYLAATDEANGEKVESCAVARASRLELLPTTFAPDGVVQVELTGASARCLVQGAGHTPTTAYDYTAVVRYFNGTGYSVAATVQPGQSIDQLDAVDLATTSIGGSRKLEDYIASWSSLTQQKIVATNANETAQVNLPGLVKIATQPVRADATAVDGLDANSVISMTVGALSCRAEDHR